MCIKPGYLLPIREGNEIKYQFTRFEPPDDYGVVNDEGEFLQSFPVGCGKCLDCIQRHKIEWIHRIMDEASLHSSNSMITLTYQYGNSDEIELNKSDFQKFMKRLRKRVGKVRYYMCGEYGSRNARPHYHAIIFGYDFPDKYFFKWSKKREKIFRSDELESLWTFGFSSITEITSKSLAYVTKDFQKLLPKNGHRVPPFNGMSNKPGIGFGAIDSKMLETGKVYHEGEYAALPRYYFNKIRERDNSAFVRHEFKFYQFKQNRQKMAKEKRENPEYFEKYSQRLKFLLQKK